MTNHGPTMARSVPEGARQHQNAPGSAETTLYWTIGSSHRSCRAERGLLGGEGSPLAGVSRAAIRDEGTVSP